MPRLSLFKPEKGQDYKFIDRQISEMFQIGATELYLHKYAGVNTSVANATADQPHYDVLQETNIQDLLFLENRDRKYDPSIYKIRGHYNVQNIDFNLSQFGLFIDNDTIFVVVHINDFIKYIGRKPISGDVFEFPHLRDEFALNDYDVALPRYYVIEDVGRASEGFSLTWYPHLYRLKLKKITDNQQFADILKKPVGEDADKYMGDYTSGTPYLNGQIVNLSGVLYQVTANPSTVLAPPAASAWALYNGNTLGNILSTRDKEYEINDNLILQAEADAPKSGYETRQFYTLAVDEKGNTILKTADETDILASNVGNDASQIDATPQRSGYTGYLLGDGYPPNGAAFGHGLTFPTTTTDGDYFLRTDFLPNRLFRYSGTMWVRMEDGVRMSMTNTSSRKTLKTGFINNDTFTGVNQQEIDFLKSPSDNLAELLTSTPYATGMSAKAYINDTEVAVTVESASGTAKIVFGSIKPQTDDRIQWKLFASSTPQKQALSKALKPKADL